MILVIYFKFQIEHAGGEDFEQFLIDIWSFWCIICLCSFMYQIIPTTKKNVGST